MGKPLNASSMTDMKRRSWIVAVCAAVVVVGIVCAVLIKRCVQRGVEEIPMEETMASIEEIRPRGEIYVCSAMMEDFTLQRATERNFILPDEEHSCVQTMTQKCSYMIDLDKVEYEAEDSTKTWRRHKAHRSCRMTGTIGLSICQTRMR